MERLTGADATFLYGETRRTPMEVANCIVIGTAGMPSGEGLLRVFHDHLESRLHLAPLLRRRLVRVPFELTHPLWIDDPDFDLGYHLRHLALPHPGTLDQLGDVVARLLSRPLDHTRPLWELYLIEGLTDGRAAVFMKTHHAAIDGVAGFELLSTLIDLSPDAPPPEPPATPWVPDREPTDLELVLGAGADLVRQPVRAFKAARRLVTGAVRLQRRGASPAAALGATSAPRTPFNVQATAHRSLRFAELDFGEIRAVKEAAGVKVNDVVLAVIGGGLRRYLQRRDELPDRSLMAFVPVTLRTDGSQGANLTSVMYVELGTDEPDPRLRLMRVVASAGDAKAAHAEMGPPAIIDLTELTGPALGALTGRLVAATRFNERTRLGGNVVVSNIPGVDVPLYASGASIERIFPIGPITDGTGLNITMLSYCGRLNVAVMGDRAAVPDPGVLAADIRAAHDELRRAVLSDRPARPRKRSSKADKGYAHGRRR